MSKMRISKNRHQKEVDDNYRFLEKNLKKIQKDSGGKEYVLLRHQKVVGYVDTFARGVEIGMELYPDHFYSVQEVANEPVCIPSVFGVGPRKKTKQGEK